MEVTDILIWYWNKEKDFCLKHETEHIYTEDISIKSHKIFASRFINKYNKYVLCLYLSSMFAFW